MASTTPCAQHPALMDNILEMKGDLGEQKAHSERLLENQGKIFDLIREMHTKQISNMEKVDQIQEDVEKLERTAADNRGRIESLNNILTNGLTSKVNTLVDKFGSCPSKSVDRMAEAVKWIRDSIWKLVFTGAIFFVIWATAKSVIFGENSLFHALLTYLNIPH